MNFGWRNVFELLILDQILNDSSSTPPRTGSRRQRARNYVGRRPENRRRSDERREHGVIK